MTLIKMIESDLLTRAKAHVRQMAPHQREREQGVLLQELIKELELRESQLNKVREIHDRLLASIATDDR